LRLFKIEKSFS